MQEVHVVTAFLVHSDRILLLRRSRQVGSYQQRWAGISGYVEEDQTPLQQVWVELEEESGLTASDLTLLKEGAPLEVVDDNLGRTWVVHPFRFGLSQPDKIKIDWEHSEYKWVYPRKIMDHTCVPGLFEAWLRVE
ncbi:MAG: NUDIX pyrophosphatase [Syntrophomonadaceae bacterium]|nr:NUDIX pyrophosphatase [Syntrophomonadaceae bacterium]